MSPIMRLPFATFPTVSCNFTENLQWCAVSSGVLCRFVHLHHTHSLFIFSLIHKHDSFTCTILLINEVGHPARPVYIEIPFSLPAHPNILTNIAKYSSFNCLAHCTSLTSSAGTSLFHLSILCFLSYFYNGHLKYPNHNCSVILRAYIADRYPVHLVYPTTAHFPWF